MGVLGIITGDLRDKAGREEAAPWLAVEMLRESFGLTTRAPASILALGSFLFSFGWEGGFFLEFVHTR